MRVVYADFDGVIFTFGNYNFSSVACKNFQSLLDQEPDLKIVISSSWRKLGLPECKRTLDFNGIDSSRVVDVTGNEPGERGDQVKAHLARNPQITSYVILDDNSDFTGFEDRLVLTSPYVGLTEADVNKAIEILRKPI
jgi:hypothetical protein